MTVCVAAVATWTGMTKRPKVARIVAIAATSTERAFPRLALRRSHIDPTPTAPQVNECTQRAVIQQADGPKGPFNVPFGAAATRGVLPVPPMALAALHPC